MKWIVLALSLLVLAVACAPPGPTCTDPYIVNGNTCCLDNNSDGVCDVDTKDNATGKTAVSCELCPPKFETITEEVIVYKYVCTNGSIMNTEEECGFIVRTNAHLFKLSTQQNPKYISEFSVRPACRGAFRAAELHLVTNQSPKEIILQAKSTPTGGYEDLAILTAEGTSFDDSYFYIGFCRDVECGQITHAQLGSEGAHVLRAKLVYNSETQTTHDVLVDPTPDGEYSKKSC